MSVCPVRTDDEISGDSCDRKNELDTSVIVDAELRETFMHSIMLRAHQREIVDYVKETIDGDIRAMLPRSMHPVILP